MKQLLTRGICTVGLMLCALNAHALLFTAELAGDHEVPPNASTASGYGSVLLDETKTALRVSLQFSGLSGAQTQAHIHGPANLTSNAPVVFPLPLGQIADFFVAITSSQLGALTNELFYFNVHSIVYPGGEIRGQITSVPEPGALVLIAVGLAAVWTFSVRARSRKRKAPSTRAPADMTIGEWLHAYVLEQKQQRSKFRAMRNPLIGNFVITPVEVRLNSTEAQSKIVVREQRSNGGGLAASRCGDITQSRTDDMPS